MNEQQYFEQFSGEATEPVVWRGIIPTGVVFADGVILSHQAFDYLHTPPFVDDKGNRPTWEMYGDIVPEWHYGRWWICNEDLVKAKKAHGDK